MNQPKLIINPYSFSGKLFEAYNDAFNLVAENDWICFKDGDACFLEMADFGHKLQDYIAKYPDTGMFTSYASRCHYQFQTRKGLDASNPDVLYWAKASQTVQGMLHPQVKEVDRRVAGHLIMMKKNVWTAILPSLTARLEQRQKKILGFDTQLSYCLLEHGYSIKLMRGILVFHYLRMLTGKNDKIK